MDCIDQVFTFDPEPKDSSVEPAFTVHPAKNTNWEEINISRFIVQIQTDKPQNKTLEIPVYIK